MNKNTICSAVGLVGSSFLLQPVSAQRQKASIQKQERPNIVVIVADDLGWGDVGFHQSTIKTPSLDRMAKQGIILDRFYTAPVSSPTRAGLMTGRYPNRFGIRKTVIPPWRDYGLDETEETMADVLADAGYQHRGMIGKWHLGHGRKVYYPLNRGFNFFYGHLNGAIDYFTHEREGELDWHKNWESCHDTGYSTDLISQEAVKYVNEHQKDPFFLYVAFNAPHTPLQAKPEDIALYTSDLNSLSKKEQNRCIYSAMVTCMDRGIGEIYRTLEKNGQLDNTIILFFSDNGGDGKGSSSGELRGFKFQEWDGGVRTAAVIQWNKGFKQPQKLEQVTGFVDVLPTLRDILGVKKTPKRELDGISVYSVLAGERQGIERDFYLGCGAVVNQSWKLILPGQNGHMKNLDSDYLVDYKSDPYEQKNSANANPAELQRLKKIVEKYDALEPVFDEVDYDKGRDTFKAPKEWKVTKP